MARRVALRVRTRMFFDRPEAIRRLDRFASRVVSRSGAFGRGAMRNLLAKKGPPASLPGEPPRRRVGLLRRFTLFALADRGKTAVIGVEPIPSLWRGAVLHGRASVPELLDRGGEQTLLVGRNRVRRRLSYAARPFTRPTLAVAERFFRREIERTPL